jgi:hypothetical protein
MNRNADSFHHLLHRIEIFFELKLTTAGAAGQIPLQSSEERVLSRAAAMYIEAVPVPFYLVDSGIAKLFPFPVDPSTFP